MLMYNRLSGVFGENLWHQRELYGKITDLVARQKRKGNRRASLSRVVKDALAEYFDRIGM